MSRLMVISLSIALGFSLIITDVYGKRYTRCGLTNLLEQLGFERSYIGQWVCLVESESGKNTSKISTRANHRMGYGIFQILSRDWCTYGRRGGMCNVLCEDMIDEYLIDDANCAKKIFQELGFKAWNGWKRSCKGRHCPLPNCGKNAIMSSITKFQ